MTHIFFFLSLLFLKPEATVHDFHVSIAEVNYNKSGKTIEVALKIFTDDLEKGITEKFNLGNVYLDKTDKHKEHIRKYIQHHFQLSKSNKSKLIMQYIGKEIENDATWIYFQFPYRGGLRNLTLKNSILLDTFNDQVNLVNFKYDSGQKTYKFQKGSSSTTLFKK